MQQEEHTFSKILDEIAIEEEKITLAKSERHLQEVN